MPNFFKEVKLKNTELLEQQINDFMQINTFLDNYCNYIPENTFGQRLCAQRLPPRTYVNPNQYFIFPINLSIAHSA